MKKYIVVIYNKKTKTEVSIPFSAIEEEADEKALDVLHETFPDTDMSDMEYDYHQV